MTPERVELVGKLFEPYGNLEGYGPALELVEHERLQRQAEALRAKIQPPRQSRRLALSTWERVDEEHAGGPAPQCM